MRVRTFLPSSDLTPLPFWMMLNGQTLEENLSKLKQTKAQLMKKQRDAQKKHEEVIQQKRREVEALRKSDRSLQKRIGRLQLENRGHKVMMDRKDHCIKSLKQKAVNAETHVMRLLQLQNRNREPAHRRGKTHRPRTRRNLLPGSEQNFVCVWCAYDDVSTAVQGRARAGGKVPPTTVKGKPGPPSAAVDNDKVEAARFLMEKMVEERLGDLETRSLLDQKVSIIPWTHALQSLQICD